MQDSALAHRAGETVQSSSFSRKYRIFSPHLWPPNSPDQNPVDYRIWGLMQERVYKTPVRDTSDLKQRLVDTRASISQNVIDEAVSKKAESERTSL